MPEIFNEPHWSHYLETGASPLQQYKAAVRASMERVSRAAWRKSLSSSRRLPVHLLAQEYPISAGSRLLQFGDMAFLHAADTWERIRIGACTPGGSPSGYNTSQPCSLCGKGQQSLSHILAECEITDPARNDFISSTDQQWRSQLHNSPPGDWPVAVLSPHLQLGRLRLAVSYCEAIENVARQIKSCILAGFAMSVCLGLSLLAAGALWVATRSLS